MMMMMMMVPSISWIEVGGSNFPDFLCLRLGIGSSSYVEYSGAGYLKTGNKIYFLIIK